MVKGFKGGWWSVGTIGVGEADIWANTKNTGKSQLLRFVKDGGSLGRDGGETDGAPIKDWTDP